MRSKPNPRATYVITTRHFNPASNHRFDSHSLFQPGMFGWTPLEVREGDNAIVISHYPFPIMNRDRDFALSARGPPGKPQAVGVSGPPFPDLGT